MGKGYELTKITKSSTNIIPTKYFNFFHSVECSKINENVEANYVASKVNAVHDLTWHRRVPASNITIKTVHLLSCL